MDVYKKYQPPHMCVVLCSVVHNAEGNQCLVINLRYVNQFLKMDSFKYEDLRTLLSILSPNDFYLRFDLKSGYHHVEIFEPHWKCMEEGEAKAFCFHYPPI